MSTPEPAQMDISAQRPSPWRNLSLVWLVPLAALAVSLGVAWKAYSDRGVLISITFKNASGIAANETTVRYRDVVIGQVENVGFAEDLSKVLVWVRIDKKIAPFLDQDAVFWVVRPEVSTRGISGLSTVLSGVYIEGAWDQDRGSPETSFEGADRPPLVQPGRGGQRITLRTNDGRMISEGAPVLFRGIEVGRLERPRLTVSGDSIVVDAFIEAPHDRRINSATRFWDSSGFSVSIGASGLSLDVDSIASLVAGGIEFDNVFDGGRPVSSGAVFDIHTDEAAARRTAFARALTGGVAVSVAFGESVAGLTSGAAVQLGGVKVGEVSSLNAAIQSGSNEAEVRLIAELQLDPSLMGLPPGAGEAEVLDFLEQAAAGGLRARLAAAGLFSSELIVELVTLEDAEPAQFNRDAEPFPELPSAPSDLPDFTATAEGALERISELPVEELMAQAIATLASIEALASADSTRQTPVAAVALLEDTRALVADPETRALPGELRSAVADLRAILSELEQGRAVANLTTALEQGGRAASSLAAASEELPALVSDFRSLADKANALETEELIRSASQLMKSADSMIDSEGARALPPALTSALDEIRLTLAELRSGGLVSNANATMASARGAADAVAAAAEGLPALSARLERLVAQSEALITAYGARSNFSSETLDALREIKSAARAVSQLARKIERQPNSLLFGK
ncbi:intermembrane transport protein PqiB [Leisingera methylohalidivorans]|uniref:Paraquat-inducible protein B n=1 Tax=Leisingera methylohalidivorans DSM 14336 TaxID=999552 RepID=V9VSA3_9RHOB|nr:MlaD family protein [Leisingera methylohalidivorans]AHD00893.1 paraquat-inducible protein B [Leisingera methylohalidivorans DSM 14336]